MYVEIRRKSIETCDIMFKLTEKFEWSGTIFFNSSFCVDCSPRFLSRSPSVFFRSSPATVSLEQTEKNNCNLASNIASLLPGQS